MPPMPHKHGATLGMHPPSCFNLSDDKHPFWPPDDFHYRRQRWADRFVVRASTLSTTLSASASPTMLPRSATPINTLPAGRVGKRHQGFDDGARSCTSL